MTETIKNIETNETGITVNFETFGVFIPFAVDRPTWDKAGVIVAERGHRLPTMEEGLAVMAATAKIDEHLKSIGKPIFDDWFWTDREHPTDQSRALCVGMYFGLVYFFTKLDTYSVRAVSAFHL